MGALCIELSAPFRLSSASAVLQRSALSALAANHRCPGALGCPGYVSTEPQAHPPGSPLGLLLKWDPEPEAPRVRGGSRGVIPGWKA